MPLTLYQFDPSPPCRAIRMVARALDLQINLKTVNIMQGEQLAVEFVKMNPLHTVPVMEDDGYILWESRAIMGYLVNRYGRDDSLYPSDAKRRGLVDQALYFDALVLHTRYTQYLGPVVFGDQKPDPEKFHKMEEGFGYFNKMLDGKDWAAGDFITIADYSLLVTVSNCEALGVDVTKYRNVSRWYTKTKAAVSGHQTINQPGAETIGQVFNSKANAA